MFESQTVDEYSDLPPDDRLATGIKGLDDVLRGGWSANHVYLVQGTPGTGKTTLAMQFLLEGAKLGEPSLYIALSETERELRAIARSHRWSLKNITVHQVLGDGNLGSPDGEYTLFHPSDVELADTLEEIIKAIKKVKPRRVVVDSLSELRIMAADRLRYRRQILNLKRALVDDGVTVLMLDDLSDTESNHIHSIAHGVLYLEQLAADYGRDRRRLRVVKMRGVAVREGYHDYKIRQGGLVVYPRLVSAEHNDHLPQVYVPSGIGKIDELLGGGLNAGTSTVVLGPAGAGKTTMSTQYALAAAKRGERSALFLFDEGIQTFYARAAGLGMDIEQFVDKGLITIQQIDPAELSPGEFAHTVRGVVDAGAKVVVIDSLTGYIQAMPAERYLILQMHELLMYLNQKGVTTLVVVAQHGLVGIVEAPIDLSYLVDTVILMQFKQTNGIVGRLISIIKKRPGRHDHGVYEFRMGEDTLAILRPFTDPMQIIDGRITSK
jgi:circadian clock protein KaiC